MRDLSDFREASLAALIIVAVPLPVHAASLIVNGGFESGFAGWTVADQIGSDGTFFIQSGTLSPVTMFPVPPPPQGTQAAITNARRSRESRPLSGGHRDGAGTLGSAGLRLRRWRSRSQQTWQPVPFPDARHARLRDRAAQPAGARRSARRRCRSVQCRGGGRHHEPFPDACRRSTRVGLHALFVRRYRASECEPERAAAAAFRGS